MWTSANNGAVNRNGRAEWIWIRPPRTDRAGLIPRGEAELSDGANRFVYFRKSFEAPEEVSGARLRASADGRYLLYLNGRRLGRGPARCHPDWQYIDPYEVAALLEPGRNILAALVHSYGRDTSWYQAPRGGQALVFGCGGFYLEAEIEGGGRSFRFGTDGTWACLPSEAWARDVPFSGTGYFEDFDARKEPAGWELPGFDDSGWPRAQVQRVSLPAAGGDLAPFPRLVERDLSPLREERILPAAGPRGAASGPLVYDFGRILLGRIGVEAWAEAGACLEIAYSESLGPDGLLHRPGAIPGIAAPIGARIRFREGPGSHLLFEAAGFRYVQLSMPAGRLRLDALWVEESSYSGGPRPAAVLAGTLGKEEGSFSCSDPLLTAVWRAGAYTAAVCRQDAFIDCPSREQRQWTGDAHIQSLLHYASCADYRLPRKALLQAAQSQRADGMLAMASAADLGTEWRTYIPDYALLWILAAADYLDYSGDASVLDEILPALAKAMDWFTPFLDGRGLLDSVPGWVFVDWSERLDKRGEVLALNALYAAAARAAARLAAAAGWDRRAEAWARLGEGVAAAAAEAFWDADRGAYADCRTGRGLSRTLSQQANAAAIAFGIAPPERWGTMLSAILDEDRLRLTRTWRWDVERPFDPEAEIVLAQPYYCRFLHEALVRAGRPEDMLENIRKRWAPMLEGGGSFWESWQLTEMTSRCHAFSATPVYDLSTYILGIGPTAPGFSRYEARPYFGSLTWAAGRFPTPRGSIALSWKREGRRVDLELHAPEGPSGVLGPAFGEAWEGVGPEGLALRPGLNRLSFEVPSST